MPNAFNYYQIGGNNRKLNPFLVNASDLRLVRNYRSIVYFAKDKRPGYTKFLDNPDTSKVYNLIHFKRNDTYRCVLRISGTSIYKYAFTGASWGAAARSNWGAVADQIQIISDTNDTSSRLDATTDRFAQGFTVSTNGTYPFIDVLLKKTGSPGNITVEIQTDNGAGKPSGVVVANGTLTITASSVTTSFAWVHAAFATAPTLTAGTQYHLVFYAASVSGAAYYDCRNATNDVYAGALNIFQNSTNSGTTWGASAMGDMNFVIYIRTGARCGHTILNNKLLIGNGADQSLYYDGSAFTVNTAAPKAKYWLTMANRAWAAGVVTNPSALYYSKVNDPTSWTTDANDVSTGGVVYIDPDNNGSIIAIDKKVGRIIVHKEFGKYKILLDEFGVPSDVIDLESDEPTSSYWSIITSGEYNYYLRETGVYRDQGTLPELISLPLGDLATNVSYASAYDAVSGKDGDFLHWSVGSITETDRLDPKTYTNCVFTYNKRTEEWSLDTLAHAPTAYGRWRHTDSATRLFFGDSAGNTFVLDGAASDGAGLASPSPIEGELIWHPFRFGDPAASKDMGNIFVTAEPGVGAIVSIKSDGGDPETIGSLENGYLSVPLSEMSQDSRSIEVSILDTSRNAASRIYGFTVEATPQNRR